MLFASDAGPDTPAVGEALGSASTVGIAEKSDGIYLPCYPNASAERLATSGRVDFAVRSSNDLDEIEPCLLQRTQSKSSEENELMKANYKPTLSVRACGKFERWMVCGLALFSFAAGSLLTARLTRLNQVRADSNRVFELMVYHTLPGKVPALEAIFRDVSKLQAKHDMNVVGYWVPGEDDPAWANTFIYLVAHPSRDEAKRNWQALHADPAFPEYGKQAIPLIEKAGEAYRVDEVYMRPSDFSAMK